MSTTLTHILSLSLAAVPVPERPPAGRPGGTLVSPPPPLGIATLGTDQAQVYGTVLLETLLGSVGGQQPQSFLGGCQSLARLVSSQPDRMEYEVLGPSGDRVCLPHLSSQMQGPGLGEAISVAFSWLNTQHSSGLLHCCSGIRPWVGVGDLCSPASPFHVFPLQFGVRHPFVLRALPTEKVQTGTLSSCVTPVWDGAAL